MFSLPHLFRTKARLAIGVSLVLLSLVSHARPEESSSSIQSNSIESFRLHAEQGDAEAMYNLGVMYSRGLEVEQNFAESLKWHRRAAEKGYVLAMRSVAMRYDKGEGTEKDYVEATKWYRKAAFLGDFASMNNLASMYSKGQGIEQNRAMACAWVTLAVESSTENPKAQPYLATYIINMKRINALLSEAEHVQVAQLIMQLRQQIAH